jgi:hypothetical protein
MQQQQQKQQQVNLKVKDYYKKYYSRNPNEILIYSNDVNLLNKKNYSIGDVDDSNFDVDDVLTDSDELFFYDNDYNFDYDENNKVIIKNKKQQNNLTDSNKSMNDKKLNKIFNNKKPPLPFPNYITPNNKLIYKSAYFTNVLSRNKSNSCENHESLLDDDDKQPKLLLIENPIITNTYSTSTSDLNSQIKFDLSPDVTIRTGIVENLRKKFLESNKIYKIPSSTSKSKCSKNTKLSDSSDTSTFSHASIKVEKNNDESSELKILNPIVTSEVKKVSTKFQHNNRLKSIERSLSTSAHIDDTFKLIKQSLVRIILFYIKNPAIFYSKSQTKIFFCCYIYQEIYFLKSLVLY